MTAKQAAGPRAEKRTSQWEELMRKFSEAHKEECKAASLEIPRAHRSVKQFPTGSKYVGSWDLFGMSGYGTYTFPNGVEYVGEFEEGVFHGEGKLRYPEGAVLRGTWKNGRLMEKTLLFADGLEYREDNWQYCKMPDRRFTIEYEKGLQPGGKPYLTADQPTREIPEGYYDTGDGFFEPKSKTIYRADNMTEIVRSAGPLEAKWIVENCRTSSDDAVGPRHELYEEWLKAQPEPKPEPLPSAAPTHSSRRETTFLDETNFSTDEAFCESLRKSTASRDKSRNSVASSRSSMFHITRSDNPFAGHYFESFCTTKSSHSSCSSKISSTRHFSTISSPSTNFCKETTPL